MGTPRYGFLPWMRQGIVNKIDLTDSVSNLTPLGRNKLDVTLTYKRDSTVLNASNLVQKEIKLIGPGDVVGINSNVIVRCEPINGVFDFEANYLPYIEFYDEDFPWRYTPAAPDGQRLRPWLALIVLKDNEFSYKAPAREDLPGAIDITGILGDIFHTKDQHYAWAHIHVHKPRDISGTPTTQDKQNFIDDLSKNGDIAVSRLLCPRRLEKKTQYTAFLIPAFESGRQAGVGADAATVDAIPTLKSSWDGSNTIFPFYHQWRFGTAELGDFETLVKALKPRVTPAELGGRDMDISRSGMGLDALFAGSTPTISETDVVMEGAVKPSTFSSGTVKTVGSAATDPYVDGLLDILNLSGAMLDPSFQTTTGLNPNIFDVTTDIKTDPVVLPPLYGQWHANVQQLVSASPKWVQEVNLDVRFRAVAGLGAQVVRDNQEKFMEMAWKQVGEVLVVNDKILKAQAALEASRAVYRKHLIADANAGIGTIERTDRTLKVASLGLRKIQMSNPAPGAPAGSKATARKVAGMTKLTEAPVNGGFQKMTRSRSNAVKQVDAKNITANGVNSGLVAKMESNSAITASKPMTASAHVASSPAAVAQGSTIAYGMTINFATTSWEYIYYHQLFEFAKTIKFYEQIETQYIPQTLNVSNLSFTVPGTAISTDLVGYIQKIMDPEKAITERVSKLIQLQVNGNLSTITNLKPVMAYPVFDLPMYEDIVKISPEYLLPNAHEYPNNSVTVLETNRRFIESYLAGLNHEFAKELLWREYPTDQRGSYFRKFWDTNDTLNFNTSDPNYMSDVEPMHKWMDFTAPDTDNLGTNHTVRHGSSSQIVVVIKGDLLKKFPNALIYIHKAEINSTTNKRDIKAIAWDPNNSSNPDPAVVRFPVFKAALQPDITLLGFAISKENAKGGLQADPGHTDGWFLVFRERPGQIKFGLDEPPAEPLTNWNALNWAHIPNAKFVDLSITLSASNSPSSSVIWGADSASMAWILYQKPAIIAIHADDMLV